MKIIYCDGSSLGNPGPAGWAVVAIDSHTKKVWEWGGREDRATNNQMELTATIVALEKILNSHRKDLKNLDEVSEENYKPIRDESSVFELRLDSKYVLQGATEWMAGWIKNGWKNSQKKQVLNKNLWLQVSRLLDKIKQEGISLRWAHVYGHTGEIWNERCDEIAKSFASKKAVKLRIGEDY